MKPLAFRAILVLLVVTNFVLVGPAWSAIDDDLNPYPKPKQSLCRRLLSFADVGLHINHYLSIDLQTRMSSTGFLRVIHQLPKETERKIIDSLNTRLRPRLPEDFRVPVTFSLINDWLAFAGSQGSKIDFNYSEVVFAFAGFGNTLEVGSSNKRVLMYSSHDPAIISKWLERRFPNWNSNQELWAFETSKSISLFSKDLNAPFTYEKGSIIVMQGMFLIGALPVVEVDP